MKIDNIARITLTVVALSVAAVLFSSVIGVIPDERKVTLTQRAKDCAAVADNIAFLVHKQEFAETQYHLSRFAQRTPSLISVGLRRSDGELVAQAGNHTLGWPGSLEEGSDGCYTIDIKTDTGHWGVLEVQYEPVFQGVGYFFSPTVFRLLLILVPILGLACWLHVKRILQMLDPTRAVPPRVQQTLDSFVGPLVVLNTKKRITRVNEAYAKLLKTDIQSLIGTRINGADWVHTDSECIKLPWDVTCSTYQAVHAQTLSRKQANGLTTIFSVTSSPVLDQEGKFKGVMIAFVDVTPLEQKRAVLASSLAKLHESKDEISKQNEELRLLATLDPLTSCVNRRTFFEKFEEIFSDATRTGRSICALMVDIDYFKSINDNYGHSMGDEVLRETAKVLNAFVRKKDIVCRYGGEEFSLLMPDLSIEEAYAAGERIRRKLADLEFSEFSITASLGVSSIALGATTPHDLLNQADKAMYMAKRDGRNRIVRFDSVPENIVVDESKISRQNPQIADKQDEGGIPFSAVTALLSALSYRDAQTGAHSTRVANYAALLAQNLLGPREVYLIEIAALLHDIGKIGVPDAILLKPGQLSKSEWEVMERHDYIGVELINKSFKHQGLTDIVKHHHSRYDGSGNRRGVVGEDIPIGARILTIADSFDAMVSDRPYRHGMPIANALSELRRCAGTQFDPNLVALFCEIVQSGVINTEIAYHTLSNDVILNIGEQIERIVDAADQGDRDSFVALTQRLRDTAKQSNLTSLTEVAQQAVEAASEDSQLEALVSESFELLAICRSLRSQSICDIRLKVDDSDEEDPYAETFGQGSVEFYHTD